MDGSANYTDIDGSRVCTDLLLIGKTGHGKSSTGNSILGRRVFQTGASPTSITKEVQMEYSEICGRIVKVVDGPGVCDTDLSQTEALELVITKMKYAVAANPRGYHAILLVVPFGRRHTNEENQTVQLLKGIFGPDFVEKFTILVVTHGDMLDPEESNTFEEWCSKQRGSFKNLLDECGPRVILFDNRTKDIAKQNDQRERLFKMIDNLSQRGERYSDQHFQTVEKERNRLVVQANHPFIREESLMEASLIIQQLGRIQLDEPEQQLNRLEQLKRRAGSLVQSIIDQDRGTGVLQEVLKNARHISLVVDEHIGNIHAALEIQAQKIQRTQDMEKLQTGEERYGQQAEGGAQQQAQLQIAELQRQIEEGQNRYVELAEQVRQKNMQLEQEYHTVATQQNEGLLPMLIRVLGAILPMALRIIFRR